MKRLVEQLENVAVIPVLFWILTNACFEFYDIAWGTGVWYQEFSRTWALLFCAFVTVCVSLFILSVYFAWRNDIFSRFKQQVIFFRKKMGDFRWLLWIAVFVAPLYFFQYTSWGVVFQKPYIRIIIWVVVTCLLSVISSQAETFAGWKQFLISLILTASSFSIAASLKDVNDYPFSLGWSEGNRLWDYSILFARDLYIYPADKKIPVLLDFGRRVVGGLPFIVPGITIGMERLWVGLTLIFPYLLLGMAAFRASSKNKLLWLILILWTFLFLKQGPIHSPLVFSAVIVVMAWRSPLKYAIPLVIASGYFTYTSRFTWVFASGMWIFMLEFASASFMGNKSATQIWRRALILGFFGLFGGLILPNLLMLTRDFSLSQTSIQASATITPPHAAPPPEITTPAPIPSSDQGTGFTYFDFVIKYVDAQPFLWYRLLPNSTYGNGILFALLLAVGPLMIIFMYLSMKKLWKITALQKLSLALPLSAFLVVGLVASTKIGGGGDLHNMDMFLIGLLFTAVLAWENGGGEWLQNDEAISSGMKIVIVLLLVISSIGPLLEMRSYTFGEEVSWLRTLTDASDTDTLEMLPTKEETNKALQVIQEQVDIARLKGEVLFMDQRQLLTFGYITNVTLVPDYEKKLLMNQALSADAKYFNGFYADLSTHRFTLIVTEPLRTPVQDSSFQFGEENNAWVKWVAGPVLCYYKPLVTLKTVRVQLLVPTKDFGDCSSVIPSP